MITEVKDQGSCGSCWAHAATEQLESYLRLQTRNQLVNISVQQITSCTPNALQLYDACVRPGRSFTVWEVSLGITGPIVPKCVSLKSGVAPLE